MSMSKRTRTPCVGICSTTYGDDVCRGCKRFAQEIINWNSFSPDEREAVWQRLEKLKTQIMKSRIKILEAFIQALCIRLNCGELIFINLFF